MTDERSRECRGSVNPMNTSTTAQCGSEIVGESLLNLIEQAKPGWLPIAWHVVSVTFTLSQREELLRRLTELEAARKALERIADGYPLHHGSFYCQQIALAALSSKEPEGK